MLRAIPEYVCMFYSVGHSGCWQYVSSYGSLPSASRHVCVQNCDGKFRNGMLSYIIDVLLALASARSGSTDLSSSPVYTAQ